MNTKVLLGIGSLVLLGGAALAFSVQQPGQSCNGACEVQTRGRSEQANGRHGGRGRMLERLHGARGAQGEGARPNGRRIGRALGVTEEQRELARGAARELSPVAEALRPKVRAIVERARALRQQGDVEGAREILKNELKPLLESAKPQAERATGPLVRSLTPEQRGKLERFAQRRGRSFDEERFSHRLGLLLGGRRAQERLQRHDRPQQR